MTDWASIVQESHLDARIRIFREQKDLAELLGYLMGKSLHCLVEVTPVEALHAIRFNLRHFGAEVYSNTEGYNNFDLRQFAGLLRAIDKILPRAQYGSLVDAGGQRYPNPNNGRILYTLSLGNEGSTVLYVDNYNGILPEHQRAIELAARNAGADEVDVLDNGTKMRIWWD